MNLSEVSVSLLRARLAATRLEIAEKLLTPFIRLSDLTLSFKKKACSRTKCLTIRDWQSFLGYCL